MAENSLTNDRSLLLDELQVLSGALADHVSSYYTTDCREEIERAVRVMREAHAALTGAVEPSGDLWKEAKCAECAAPLEPGKYCSVTCATNALNRKSSAPNRRGD